MATDAVQGAVADLLLLAEKLKSGKGFFDVDAMVDSVESTALGLSHLRAGAGQVQTNLEELESKVKSELVGGVSSRIIAGETAMQNIIGRMAALKQKVIARLMIFTGMTNAGMSIGGKGGKGGDRTKGILENKAMQFL